MCSIQKMKIKLVQEIITPPGHLWTVILGLVGPFTRIYTWKQIFLYHFVLEILILKFYTYMILRSLVLYFNIYIIIKYMTNNIYLYNLNKIIINIL